MKFKMNIKGKSKHASTEFIRAWFHATAAVLGYHGYLIDLSTLKIKVLDLSARSNRITGGGVAGTANASTNKIELDSDSRKESMAAIIIHECIHIAVPRFGKHTNEKCVSTLTGKLKPTIAVLAQKMIDECYRNAAYIANCQKTKSGGDMPYRNPEGSKDNYNPIQWVEVGAEDPHHDRRKRQKRKDLELKRLDEDRAWKRDIERMAERREEAREAEDKAMEGGA